MYKLASFILILLLALFSTTGVSDARYSAKVISVADGDTITVLTPAKVKKKIRLYGIDAPERPQAFGKTSRKHLSELVFGEEVSVLTKEKDRYGREVAFVYLGGERNVNYEMVAAGLAWWYRRYASEDATLERLENEARVKRKGLFQDKNPTPPWKFREQKRSAGLEK